MATVFWDPRDCPHVLDVFAEPVAHSADATPFHWADICCRASVLLISDRLQHVMLREGGQCLQLVISGADFSRPVLLRTDAIVHPDRIGAHLAALACLNDLRATGRLLPKHFPLAFRRRRLRIVLRALDGSLAGASHRQIAVALFGSARVDADWLDPGDHLRDHVRRAIRRGRLLMNGGYRQFLR